MHIYIYFLNIFQYLYFLMLLFCYINVHGDFNLSPLIDYLTRTVAITINLNLKSLKFDLFG